MGEERSVGIYFLQSMLCNSILKASEGVWQE